MSAETPLDPYVILGCGYTGIRLAQALRKDGVAVRACARRTEPLLPLRELGVDVYALDAARPRQFAPALRGMSGAVVVYSIPGVPQLPAGEAVRRATDAALQAGARAFIYLSTSGVFGRSATPDNDEWIDEDSPVDFSDAEMLPRLSDEAVVSSASSGGLRGVVLRLSAIYGPPLRLGAPASGSDRPGRGVRQRLRQGQYKLWDGGRYYFSRIHVDDLVTVIRAAAQRAPAGSTYVVGDDLPCPQGEYGKWLAAHLSLPEPPQADSLVSAGPRTMIRGRRLQNRRMKEQLGVTLRYPTYREGELQIDAAEAAEAAGPAAAVPAANARQTPSEAAAVGASASPSASPAVSAHSDAAASGTSTAPVTSSPASGPADVAASSTSVAPNASSPASGRADAAASAHAGQHRPLAPGDLGTLLGLSPIGAECLDLAPGASAQPGRIYLVLEGNPLLCLDGQELPVEPLTLIPPRATLRNGAGLHDAKRVLLLALPGPLPPA